MTERLMTHPEGRSRMVVRGVVAGVGVVEAGRAGNQVVGRPGAPLEPGLRRVEHPDRPASNPVVYSRPLSYLQAESMLPGR